MTTESASLRPAPDSRFAPGQVWRYQTRPGEEASRAIIGKVEESPRLGIIVHVKLVGLRIMNEDAPSGISPLIAHLPIQEAAFATSVTTLADEAGELDDFAEGYEDWHASFRAGKAGIWTITLAEIVAGIEEALNANQTSERLH